MLSAYQSMLLAEYYVQMTLQFLKEDDPNAEEALWQAKDMLHASNPMVGCFESNKSQSSRETMVRIYAELEKMGVFEKATKCF